MRNNKNDHFHKIADDWTFFLKDNQQTFALGQMAR